MLSEAPRVCTGVHCAFALSDDESERGANYHGGHQPRYPRYRSVGPDFRNEGILHPHSDRNAA